MAKVAVIDYGMGNLHSVSKALEKVADSRTEVVVSADPETIMQADRVVLPGVGAIRDCMAEIKRLGLDQVVCEVAQNKPLLGVCVGMQALLEHSEENDGVDCLGILPGQVRYFGRDLRDPVSGIRLKVPHMGWNQLHQCLEHPLWRNIPQDTRFYFVHSYYVSMDAGCSAAATTDYGVTFKAAVVRDNVFAVQCHPEKSAAAGLELYANFLKWDGQS